MRWVVMLLRLIVGATFIVSGWAKAIDVWGFVFKLEEYLSVWHTALPHEVLVAVASAVACMEFLLGVMVLTGCYRRVAVWGCAAYMVVLLPLTAWIALTDPVSDCGCFGDFITLSNTATLAKNAVLTVLIVLLLIFNRRVGSIYRPDIQWIATTISLAFIILIAGTGYRVQPLIDFRAYPPGSSLTDNAGPGETLLTYEKDGRTIEVPLDRLPDSTWTFVAASTARLGADELVVLDDDGSDITSDVICDEGPQMLLVVNDTDIESLSRIHLADLFGRYMADHGGSMTALAGTTDSARLARWNEIAMLSQPAYGVEPKSLKALVRGNTAVVMLHDGIVCWKRRLDSFPADYFDNPEADRSLLEMPCAEAAEIDSEHHLWLCCLYVALMAIVYIFNYFFVTKKSYRNENQPDSSDSSCSSDACTLSDSLPNP